MLGKHYETELLPNFMKSIPKDHDFPRPVRPLRAVAFDLDGLMFNTEDLYETVDRAILERRGKDLTRELIDMMIGLPTPIALQIMIDHYQLDATVAELTDESDLEFEKILSRHLAPMPGLLNLLDTLDAAELTKGVATSSARNFAEAVLGQFQLGPRFDFILSAEDVRDGKPAPEVYIEAARRAAQPSQPDLQPGADRASLRPLERADRMRMVAPIP